jgi:hypothetical protein
MCARSLILIAARVFQYLVWRTEDRAIKWWALEEDEFHAITAGDDGEHAQFVARLKAKT